MNQEPDRLMKKSKAAHLEDVQSSTFTHTTYHQKAFNHFIEVCKSIYEDKK